MHFDAWWKGFLTALRLLTRLPVPGENSTDGRAVLAGFPLVGALAGVALWGTSAVLRYALENPLGPALLCGILLPPLAWWFTEGRNVRGVVWVVSNWSLAETEDPEEGRYRPYWVLLTVQTLLLCRVFCFAALVHAGSGLWLAVGPVLAFSVHAELVERQLAEGQVRGRWPLHWLLGAALTLLAAVLLKALLAGVLALVLAWVLSGFLARLVEANCGRFEEAGHGAVREAVDVVTLLTGILYFLSRA